MNLEREEFKITVHAGAVLKADLQTSLNAISRKQLLEQIKVFVQQQPQWLTDWDAHFKKCYLPEKFVLAFICHISENPTIKIV